MLLFFLLLCIPQYSGLASQKLTVGKVNSTDTDFGLYHSYRYKQLLIAFTHRNGKTFECLPNRYIFYNYGLEDYFEIAAGNLLLNPDFTQFITTHIHTLTEPNGTTNPEGRGQVDRLAAKLKVSTATLKKGKTVGNDGKTACWQQPELYDARGSRIARYSLLAANLCEKLWCGDFLWPSTDRVQFWIRTLPDKQHWIELNTATGKIARLRSRTAFSLPDRPQQNAPRDNLISEQNREKGQFVLPSQKENRIGVFWERRGDGLTEIGLIREKSDRVAAGRTLKRVKAELRQKNLPAALNSIRFALWLDPNNDDVKFEHLKALASLHRYDEIFVRLRERFAKPERMKACQKMHVEKSFSKLWSREKYLAKFREACF